MATEEHGDFKLIARVYFCPVSIQIFDNSPKYAEAIALAQKEYEDIAANLDRPIKVSATGQTIMPCAGPDKKQ